MLGPILMRVVQTAAEPLASVFARTAVTAATTVATTAALGGVINAGKKIYQNSQKGRYQCNKCGREFRGMPGTDMYCPGCGKRLHLN